MSNAQYGLSGVGRSGAMLSGYAAYGVLAQIGRYYTPALSGIGRSGSMLSGMISAATSLRKIDNLSITMTGQRENPECSFDLVSTLTDAPAEGAPVVIAIGTMQAPIFRGYLTEATREQLAPGRFKFACRAVGLLRDLERVAITGAWSNQYAGDILTGLLATHAPHLRVEGYVERGAALESFQASGEMLDAVCSRLAALSGYAFFLAANRHVHFHAPVTLPAPWAIDDVEAYGKLSITEESSALRTRVFVNYSQLQSREESFVGDGAAKTFTLAVVPNAIATLTVNGAAVTFDAAYSTDNAANDFSMDYTRGIINTRAHAILTTSDTLTCAYTAKVPAQLTRIDAAARAERQQIDGGSGLYDYTITDRDGILSQADARAAADAILDQYARARISARYTRVEPLGGVLSRALQPGQRQELAQWGVAAPLEIQKVTISVLRPAADASLRWQLDVELGAASERLDTALSTTTTAIITNTIIEEETR